jgi:S1-C subfamily serine protease
MDNNNRSTKKINYSVVRIIADDIDFNWRIPYTLNEPKKGNGTGFFIDDTHILTCSHVVSNSKNVYIEIPAKSSDKYYCDVVSICPFFDIALLKTKNYKSLYYVNLGNSDNLKVGSKVEVVGYPVGFSKTKDGINNLKFTSGIISGQQNKYIQTDSSINPGNSGGPLFSKGVVIGINSSKLVADNLDNIGYAIPINNFKIIKDNMLKEKIVYRPNLLFEYNNTDKNLISQLTNGKVDKGILISKIYNKSILKGNSKENSKTTITKISKNNKSHIDKDCILTEIDGYKIDNFGLTDYKWLGTHVNIDIILNKFKNNENVNITYYQNGNKYINKITLKPFVPEVRSMFPAIENIEYIILGGMIFMNLAKNHLEGETPLKLLCNNMKNNNDNDYDKPKVIVSYIYPNTEVNILNNIKVDNIILKVNDIKINNISSMRNALKKPIVINKKQYIKIENEDGKSVLMLKTDINKQNEIFSQLYGYKKE